jgi:hypothetical protein
MLDEEYAKKNYSSIIREMFPNRNSRQEYYDEYSSDDMEVSTMADIRREELKR